MAQQVRYREQKTVDFSSNNTVPTTLGRGMVLRELAIELTATPTLTAANSTQAKTAPGALWGVIKSIDIVVNSSDTIRSFTGEQLVWLNRYWYGGYPKIDFQLGDEATANPVCKGWLIIPFWTPNSVRPIDTALDTRKLSDLRIDINWGTYTDINTSASAWTTEPQAKIHTLESFGIGGDFAQTRLNRRIVTLGGANSNELVDLGVGPMYRSFLINTKVSGADDSGVIQNVKLVSGSTVFTDFNLESLREYNMSRRGMQRYFTDTTLGSYHTVTRDSDEVENAWHYVDLVTDGLMTEAIDTLGFAEFNMELDVLKAGTLTILPYQITPVRGGG